MPRVAATAAWAARSTPARSADPLSAHAVWIQSPKARSGRPARRAAAPPRSATASHSVNRPSRISDITSALDISATIVSSGSVTSEATSSSTTAARRVKQAADSHQTVPSRMYPQPPRRR